MAQSGFEFVLVVCAALAGSAVAPSNDEALDGYIAGWHVGNPSDIKAYQGANYTFHFHGVTAPAGVDADGFVDFFTDFRKTVAAAGGPAEDSTDFMRTYGAVRQNVSGYTLETGAFVVPGFGSGTYHAYARDGVVEMEEAVAFAAGVECLSSVPAESLPVSGAPQQGPVVDVGSDSTAGEAAMERLQRYLSAWGLGDASAIHTEVTPSYRVFFAGFTPADGVNASGFEAFFGGMRQSIAAVGGPAVDSTDFMQLQGEMSRTLTGVDGGSFSINSGAFVVRGFGTGVYHAIGDNMGVLAENAVAFGAGLECMHSASPDVNDVKVPEADNAVPKSVWWWPLLMLIGLTSFALFVQT